MTKNSFDTFCFFCALLLLLSSLGCKDSDPTILFDIIVYEGVSQIPIREGSVQIIGWDYTGIPLAPTQLFEVQEPIDAMGRANFSLEVDENVEILDFNYLDVAGSNGRGAESVLNCPDGTVNLLNSTCDFDLDDLEYRVSLLVFD